MGKNSKGKAAKQPAPGERQVIANNKKVKGLKYSVCTTVLFDKAWLDS